jgi:hypothetical protein
MNEGFTTSAETPRETPRRPKGMAEPAEVAGFCSTLFSWVLQKETRRTPQNPQRYRITVIQAHTMAKKFFTKRSNTAWQ